MKTYLVIWEIGTVSIFTVKDKTELIRMMNACLKVCTVEPGYFRSNFLKPGNKIVKQNIIPDYEGTAVRKGEEIMDAYDNKQPGDIKKGAKVMLDVLTGALGREIPKRLILGSDAFSLVKGKCEETIKILDEWKEVSVSTDIDEK